LFIPVNSPIGKIFDPTAKSPYPIVHISVQSSPKTYCQLDYKVLEKGQPGVVGGGEKKFYAQIPVRSGE